MRRERFARTLLWCNNHTQGTLFAVYRKFRQALDAQCWFDDVFETFHAEETLCSVGYCMLHNLRVRLIKFRVCSRCLMWLIILNSNIDCLQGNTTDIYRPNLRFGRYRSYCPEGSQYYLNILLLGFNQHAELLHGTLCRVWHFQYMRNVTTKVMIIELLFGHNAINWFSLIGTLCSLNKKMVVA